MLHNSEKDFIKRHIGLSKEDEKNMLNKLGYTNSTKVKSVAQMYVSKFVKI